MYNSVLAQIVFEPFVLSNCKATQFITVERWVHAEITTGLVTFFENLGLIGGSLEFSLIHPNGLDCSAKPQS